jgi:P4 family phage/plasmid primase-like protien
MSNLFAAGYRDLVLIKPREKAPAKGGWLHNRPTAEQVVAWQGNLGLIAEKFPAIDIDLFDEAQSNEVVKLALKKLGPAPLRLSHRPASKLLVYRTEHPFRKKVLTLPDAQGKVEILGAGRQYLISGIHPEGTPYRWAKTPLWEIESTKLTLVTEDQIEMFLALLKERFGGFIGRASAAADTVVPPEELAAPSLERVEQVMRTLPNSDAFLRSALPPQSDARSYWVAMGHIVKGAAGAAGEDAFVEWTSRYEDGPVDLDDAREVYQGLNPERYGWPTLDRILREVIDRIPAEDEFEAEEAPPADVIPPWAVQYSDEYMTDRIAPKVRDRMIYSAAWMTWDGRQWVADETQDALRAEMILRSEMRAFAENIMAASFAAPSAGEAQQLRQRAKTLMNRGGMRTILDHLRGPLLVPIDDFNADLLSLNTPAGLIDLRDGSMRSSKPEDLVSRMTGVAPSGRYNPKKAPHWVAFLEHLTGGDAALASFIQRYMGYCLTGQMGEKKFVFAWGSNSNTGKSTFVRAAAHALGSYAASDDVNLFMGGMGENRRASGLARLLGVRLFLGTEPAVGRKWDDESIKKITGGDRVTARRLFQEPFEYMPQFKIMIAGNHEPELRNVDGALLQRILIVPMNNQVATEAQDPHLSKKLEGEASEILQWMIEGCLEWQKSGLQPPEAVQAATEEYRDTEDLHAQWLGECCDVGPEHRATTGDLFTSWREWCNRRGRPAEGLTAFSRALAARSGEWRLERYRSASERGYMGIRIKPRLALGTDFEEGE